MFLESWYEAIRILLRLSASLPAIFIVALLWFGFFYLGQVTAKYHLVKYHFDSLHNSETHKLKLEIEHLKKQVEHLQLYRARIVQIKAILK